MNDNVVVRFPKVYKPLADPWRYKVLYGGRNAARSWTIARRLLIRGTQNPEFILCTRELQKSIKQSVHRLLKKQIRLLHLEAFYTITEQSIKGINGTEFMFLGVKANPEEVRSTEGVTICWIEEGHSLSESSWDIIDPTIREEGSEIWISFNTRFKFDYLYHKFVVSEPPSNALVLKTSYLDNPYFSEVLREQMTKMKKDDYEKYLNIWEGELKLLAEGAVFGKQIKAIRQDNRLLKIPVVKGVEVETFWDVGKSDYTVIWFMQRVGKEYRFIDFYMSRGDDLEDYAKVLKKLDYNYGRHYLPHDTKHERLGMVSSIEVQLRNLGIKPATVVPRIPEKQAAIRMTQNMLNECYFHTGDDPRGRRMAQGWDGLCNFRYKFVDDKNKYNEAPFHDWAMDVADAFMQFAQGYNEKLKAYEKPIVMNNAFNIF